MTHVHPHAEISSLLARLFHAVDAGDEELFLECWTEDAVLRMTDHCGHTAEFIGRENIRRGTAHVFTEEPTDLRHMLVNVAVDPVNKYEAIADAYALYVKVDQVAMLAGAGKYRDYLVREDGEWRIRDRTLEFLSDVL